MFLGSRVHSEAWTLPEAGLWSVENGLRRLWLSEASAARRREVLGAGLAGDGLQGRQSEGLEPVWAEMPRGLGLAMQDCSCCWMWMGMAKLVPAG